MTRYYGEELVSDLAEVIAIAASYAHDENGKRVRAIMNVAMLTSIALNALDKAAYDDAEIFMDNESIDDKRRVNVHRSTLGFRSFLSSPILPYRNTTIQDHLNV